MIYKAAEVIFGTGRVDLKRLRGSTNRVGPTQKLRRGKADLIYNKTFGKKVTQQLNITF